MCGRAVIFGGCVIDRRAKMCFFIDAKFCAFSCSRSWHVVHRVRSSLLSSASGVVKGSADSSYADDIESDWWPWCECCCCCFCWACWCCCCLRDECFVSGIASARWWWGWWWCDVDFMLLNSANVNELSSFFRLLLALRVFWCCWWADAPFAAVSG